jgi:O-antigen/teichoic acid export membrane protein
MHARSLRIVRNIFSLSFGELSAKLLSFAAIVYIARVSGSETLGIIGFATAALSYFSLAANPGLDTIGLREIAGESTHARSSSNIFAARLLLLLPVGALFLLFVFLPDLGHTKKLVLLFFGATLLLTPLSLDFYFMGLERMGVVAFRKTLQAVLYLIGIILLVTGPDDILLIPIVFCLAMCISFVPQPLFLKEKRILRANEITRTRLQALLGTAIVVGGAQMFIMTYLQIDLVMCGIMLPNDQVGWYTAAQRITAGFSMLAYVLLQAHMPELTRATTGTERSAALRHLMWVMVVPGLLLSAGGFVFAEQLLLLVFGNSYLSGSDALRILSLNTGLVFVNMALANPLLAWKHDREYLSIVLGGALMNIILNAVLIPRYGISGAAWATLTAEGLVFILAFRIQRALLRQ